LVEVGVRTTSKRCDSLEIIVANHAGFCFGVQRAMKMTEEARRSNQSLRTLGPLIHNPQVVKRLGEQGITIAAEPEDVKEGSIIIRSHGISPEVLDKLEAQGVTIINATCPFVSRAQKRASHLSNQGYQVVIVGDRNHPEVIGILGWAQGKAKIVESPSEAAALAAYDKIAVIAQTTQPEDNFQAVVNVLKDKTNNLVIHNTICSATRERQEAAKLLAKAVDLMIVVGGKNSANTKKLAKICQEAGATTHHIENVAELCEPWFNNIVKVGVTAGASTPEWIIEEVVLKMEDIKKEQEIEQTEAAVEEEKAEAGEVETDQEAVEAQLNENMPELRRGSIITGKIVQINDNEVMVSVGGKSEGIIPINEVSMRHVDNPEEVISIGDEVSVVVIKPENDEGHPILSLKRAERDKAWEKLEDAFKEETELEAEVLEVVKGGLLVDVGIKGFVPASLVDRGYVEDLNSYVGTNLRLQVIELDRGKNKVVLSKKAILDKEYEQKRQETWEAIEEGQVCKGIVRRLTDFGAFVDLGGVDGLLHVSELSWGRVDHPRDILEEGQEIEVKVLGVDREEERVSLGLKQLKANPWDTAAERYPEGTVVEGTVLRAAPFGAFVEVEPGIEGLVHISQLSHEHVEKTEDAVTPGDKVEVKVLGVDEEAQRMSLSVKETQPRPKKQAPQQPKQQQKASGNQQVQTEETGITLGDMLGEEIRRKLQGKDE